MELTAGYEFTEVGMVPDTWAVSRLGDISEVTAGGTPSRAIAAYWNGDISWVTTSEIDFTEITFTQQFITDDGLLNSAAKRLVPGTLLMALYGQGKTRGKVGILGIPAATNQACAAISVNENASHLYVFHWLRSRYDAIRKLSNSGSQDNLSGSLVRSILVPLPPIAEQHAIATALGDVDALLEGLDQLIAKKRDLKQAAMQDLLTGRTRLPGFHGEWEVAGLSALCAMKSGEGITGADIDDFAMYPCYGGNGIRGYTSRFTHEGRFALIGRQGALCGNVVEVNGRFFASEHAVVVTPKLRTDIRWLAYVLGTMNLNQYSESSAQPGLSVSKILMLEVDVPPSKAEQAAIANVLSDMDAELSALESRRDKTLALKQAMMQELLTGRTRLV